MSASITRIRIAAVVGLASVLAAGLMSVAHAGAPREEPWTPTPGTPCDVGMSHTHNGLVWTCVRVKDKKTGKFRYVWSKPTFADNADGDLRYIESIPVKDMWTLGPLALDSQDMDFMPVDPEAVALPDGRVRLIVDEPDGAATLHTYTSTDGVTFTPESPTFNGTFPSVVRLADGRYRMYFTRFSPEAGTEQILSAVSDDALNWTQEPGVRGVGAESSAVILKDGRTLMAIRRTSPTPLSPGRSCNTEGSSIWLAVSQDGLTFSEPKLAVDGAKERALSGRAYGVELARMVNGKVMMYYEGCIPMFATPVNEKTLKLGKPVRSSLRGPGTAEHFGFPDAGDGVYGGDVSIIIHEGKNWAYFSTRSQDGDSRWGGLRQRVVIATKG